MTTSLSLTARLSGIALCALGAWILAGWAIGDIRLVRVLPGSTAMAINTAVMFLLAGMTVLLSTGRGGPATLLRRGAIAVLIMLPLLILFQHATGIDLGIDWPAIHAALGDGHGKPGRTAPNACLGFLFAGIVFAMREARPADTPLSRLAIGLSAAVFVIGATAFAGFLLELEVLYQVATYNKMAVLTALGMTVLGIGCLALALGERHTDAAGDGRRITALSALLLSAFAVVAGVTAFGILKDSYEQSAADSLWRTSRISATGVSSLLDKALLLSRSVAMQPQLHAELLALHRDPGNLRALGQLRATARKDLELGFGSIRIVDARGALLAAAGDSADDRVLAQAPLGATADHARLLWKNGYIFHAEHEIRDNGDVIGRIVTQRPLEKFTEFMHAAQHIGATSDLVLCARDGDQVSCFPSRFYATSVRHPMFTRDGRPTLPIARALLGESGSTSARDLRGRMVLAGFVPVPHYRLALVQKIEVAELYAPLRDKLPPMMLAVAVFIAIGTLLLRAWVRPIVQRIVGQRARMKSILDNSNDAFIAVDADGRVSDWNREAERLFGWSQQEAVGRDLGEMIVPPAQRAAHDSGMRRFLEAGSGPMLNRRVQVMAQDRHGRELPVELSIAPFRDGHGFAASAFLRDLTAQKQAERELEQARAALAQSQKLEAVGKLTGGVAHDFNNVLQVIRGSLQLLQAENDGSALVQRRVAAATGAVERGARLAQQLLAFARRQPLQPTVTNVGRVARGMNDMLQRALGETIDLETSVAGGLWNTLVDNHQLEQVILNLAINARDAMQGQGKLTIEVGNAILDEEYARLEPGLAAGQYVLLAISDTGCGMPPEVRERAFEPFFTTKPEGAGTGLGLSMAYGFVKQSGGHIRIYSEVGHGTTIKIYLPRSFDKEEPAAPPPASDIAGGSETILVVEDDLAVQETVVELLAGLGYKVLRADNGEAALAVLKAGAKIDLLFTDVVMPGPLRSPELARQARQLVPGIRVLFTSGYTQNAIVHGGRLDPGVHLLSKPYGREQLARKVRELLGPQPQAARSGLRIAFVEDNEDFRQLGIEMLVAIGHRVQAFPHAEAALVALQPGAFDVLLTDVGLPGMSGDMLAVAAAKIDPALRIILATGYGDSAGQDGGGNFDVLPKPFTLLALQEALRPALQRIG